MKMLWLPIILRQRYKVEVSKIKRSKRAKVRPSRVVIDFTGREKEMLYLEIAKKYCAL